MAARQTIPVTIIIVVYAVEDKKTSMVMLFARMIPMERTIRFRAWKKTFKAEENSKKQDDWAFIYRVGRHVSRVSNGREICY